MIDAPAAHGLSALLCPLLLTACASAPESSEARGELLGPWTVAYHVADLEAATEWYTQALGKAPYFNESFYVGFDVGGHELGLDPDTSAVAAGGGPVVYWGVESLEHSFPRLLDLGAEPVTGIQEVGGDIRIVILRDPFGHLLGLIENPNFESAPR